MRDITNICNQSGGTYAGRVKKGYTTQDTMMNPADIKPEPLDVKQELNPDSTTGNTPKKKPGRPKGSLGKKKTQPPSNQPMITDHVTVVKKEKRKHDRFKGMPESEVLLRLLPDRLEPDLDIVIVGINPGLYAAFVGHHYAGPGNHFWKCMFLSGLLPEQMTAMQDEELLKYGIGFTNIVARTSRGSADLTRKEIKEGAEILTEKLLKYRPKIAVFNGKGIYEVFVGHKNFYFGKQPDLLPGTNTAVYVMPSSSARCSQLPRAIDKVPFYNALRKFRDNLCGKLPDLDDSEITFPDLELKTAKKEPKEEVKEEFPGENSNMGQMSGDAGLEQFMGGAYQFIPHTQQSTYQHDPHMNNMYSSQGYPQIKQEPGTGHPMQGMDPRMQGNGPQMHGMDPRMQGNGPQMHGMDPRMQGMHPQMQGNGPQMHGNFQMQGHDPQMYGNAPQMQMNGPQMQGQDPQMQGNGPHMQGNNPQMQGNNPHMQGHNPQMQGNNPQMQGNDPQMQGCNPQMQGNNQQIQGNNPHMQENDPQMQGNNPQTQGNNQQMQDSGPQLQENDKQTQENKSQTQDSNAQPQDCSSRLQASSPQKQGSSPQMQASSPPEGGPQMPQLQQMVSVKLEPGLEPPSSCPSQANSSSPGQSPANPSYSSHQSQGYTSPQQQPPTSYPSSNGGNFMNGLNGLVEKFGAPGQYGVLQQKGQAGNRPIQFNDALCDILTEGNSFEFIPEPTAQQQPPQTNKKSKSRKRKSVETSPPPQSLSRPTSVGSNSNSQSSSTPPQSGADPSHPPANSLPITQPLPVNPHPAFTQGYPMFPPSSMPGLPSFPHPPGSQGAGNQGPAGQPGPGFQPSSYAQMMNVSMPSMSYGPGGPGGPPGPYPGPGFMPHPGMQMMYPPHPGQFPPGQFPSGGQMHGSFMDPQGQYPGPMAPQAVNVKQEKPDD